jgi:hypothetical protein
MQRKQWQQVWWHFTRPLWRTLGQVVRYDHVTAEHLPLAEVLVEHGFLKDLEPRPDGLYHAYVTGAGLQAWEWYLTRSRAGPRLGRQWRTRLWV